MLKKSLVLCVLVVVLFGCQIDSDNNIFSDNLEANPDYSIENQTQINELKSVEYNSSGNLANLTALRIDVPVFGIVGDAIDVYVEAENNGTVTSTTTCSVYLSENKIISLNDTFLGTISIGSLANGQFGNASQSLQIPSDMYYGTYYAGFIIDQSNSVNETKEYDNILDANNVVAIQIGRPNLTITSMTAPSSTSSDFYLEFTITNTGNVRANAFEFMIYFSTNTAISSGDEVVNILDMTDENYGIAYNFGISAGEAVTFRYYIDSAYYYSGIAINYNTYYLGIVLDSNNDLIESNESDNIRYSKIVIQ